MYTQTPPSRRYMINGEDSKFVPRQLKLNMMMHFDHLPFHEPLSFTVPQDAPFTSTALCDEAACSVDACGMELHKLQVLEGQTSTSNHSTAITCARQSKNTLSKTSDIVKGIC